MYPGYLHVGSGTEVGMQRKALTDKEYFEPHHSRPIQLLMKAYLLIARWIINPKQTRVELETMRRSPIMCNILHRRSSKLSQSC